MRLPAVKRMRLEDKLERERSGQSASVKYARELMIKEHGERRLRAFETWCNNKLNSGSDWYSCYCMACEPRFGSPDRVHATPFEKRVSPSEEDDFDCGHTGKILELFDIERLRCAKCDKDMWTSKEEAVRCRLCHIYEDREDDEPLRHFPDSVLASIDWKALHAAEFEGADDTSLWIDGFVFATCEYDGSGYDNGCELPAEFGGGETGQAAAICLRYMYAPLSQPTGAVTQPGAHDDVGNSGAELAPEHPWAPVEAARVVNAAASASLRAAEQLRGQAVSDPRLPSIGAAVGIIGQRHQPNGKVDGAIVAPQDSHSVPPPPLPTGAQPPPPTGPPPTPLTPLQMSTQQEQQKVRAENLSSARKAAAATHKNLCRAIATFNDHMDAL